jgi:hypothetical protein
MEQNLYVSFLPDQENLNIKIHKIIISALILYGSLGKKPLGRPKHKRENNIKTDLKEIRCEGHGMAASGSE